MEPISLTGVEEGNTPTSRVCVCFGSKQNKTEEKFFPLRNDRGVCFTLKGRLHEIFGPIFWPVWIHLGLNVNQWWFLNFNDAP
jgi:hypothetical protein